MKTIFTVHGTKTIFTVQNTNVLFEVENTRIVFTVSGTGPQGPSGIAAIERKLFIGKFRYLPGAGGSVQTEIILNNTGITDVTIDAWNNIISILSELLERPHLIHVTNIAPSSIGYYYYEVIMQYKIDSLSLIYKNGSTTSEWAYVIIEDLTQYIPT